MEILSHEKWKNLDMLSARAYSFYRLQVSDYAAKSEEGNVLQNKEKHENKNTLGEESMKLVGESK